MSDSSSLLNQVFNKFGISKNAVELEIKSQISTLPTSSNVRKQNIKFSQEVIDFCQGVQAAAPVDSYVKPEPWAMPGYDSEVIMAAGAFIQGSSIELSADAPIKPPYNVYF